MATCKIINEPRYALTLTGSEATALRLLVGSVIGSSHNTFRRHTNSIYDALCEAGVFSPEDSDSFSRGDFTALKDVP